MTTTAHHSPVESSLVDLDAAISATPDAVRVAMQKAIPDRYTPELAAKISADVIAQLNAMRTPPSPLADVLGARLGVLETVVQHLQQEHDPEARARGTEAVQAALDATRQDLAPVVLTAAERGPAWLARYGCPIPDCTLDHAGRDGEPGWHQTAGVETLARDIDADVPDPVQPFMSATVTVLDDRAEAYGRTTEVWLSYGVCTAQLTPARAREIVEDIRRFADGLEAVCDRADEIAVDDHDGDPVLRARYDAETDERIRAVTEGGA